MAIFMAAILVPALAVVLLTGEFNACARSVGKYQLRPFSRWQRLPMGQQRPNHTGMGNEDHFRQVKAIHERQRSLLQHQG
jgi:hypothetical protein